jgi:DHA1 family bicyclomycin/chloramphenicol resistance-like MFS transporter
LNRAKRLELIVLLGALTAFAPMSIDMYLPALPTLEQVFSASTAQVQRTIATFFLGFACGQAFYGPIADRYGRRVPLYLGLGVFVAASIGCALAPSIGALTALRLLQALGACAGTVIARAVVRDVFPPLEAPRIYAALMLVMGVAPMLAPLLGGFILVTLDWSAIFWVLAAFGSLCLVAAHFRLPDTHGAEPARSLALRHVLTGYGRLLADRQYMGYALTGGASMGGLFAYIAGSPFVFIELNGVAAQHFGWFFGANAAGFVVAAQVNHRVLRWTSSHAMLRHANLVQAATGLVLLATAATGIGGLAGIAGPLFIFVASFGFVLPNSTALAMAPHGRAAGFASALLGSMQFAIAALAATSVGLLHDGTAVPMAGLIAAAGLLGLAVNRLLTGDAGSRLVVGESPD